MTEPLKSRSEAEFPDHHPSLAEVAARRTAARTQWQKALARAKERFTPLNMANETLDTAADKIGGAADQVAETVWAHRGKLALAGVLGGLGGLFFAREPIARATAPAVSKVKSSMQHGAERLRKLTKR